MTIIGGTVATIGFVISSYCTSVEQLFFSFGILSGLGLGVGYVTVVVSIAFWFDKKRTFATGIGASGTGIGTFLYAPLTQWLLDNFGWRGTTLILAGTLFNIIDILCARSADQRTQILETYASELGRDLIEDLKSELGGKFEDVIVALMMPADKFLCKQLRKAMDGIGTNEDALIEILAPQTNEIPSVPIYYLAKPQPRERAWKH